MHSEYLKYLPRVFKEAPGDEAKFLDQYLKVFEALLSGRDDGKIDDSSAPGNKITVTGLEKAISQFVNCLDAGLTPVEERIYTGEKHLDSPFLNYLSSWVALLLDQNWELDKKRQWLQKIVPLYKKRGTKAGLLEYLKMFVGPQVLIEEPEGGFILGEIESSILGINTLVNEPTYFFWVRFNYGFPPEDFDINRWRNLWKGTRYIIDLEKPVHTYYDIDARTPGIIVGKRSTVEKDTLIWERSYYKLEAHKAGIVLGDSESSVIGVNTIISNDTLVWNDIYIWEDYG